MGTMTFGGRGAFAKTGATDVAGARRQIDMCLDAGVNLIDTANVYSAGPSEEIIGEALAGNARQGPLATKARFPMGDGPNDAGLSRHHLIAACEASLKRLRTDRIDLYQMHEWDGQTPLEETLDALDNLVRAGKVRYVGCSNFSGWHLMKALAVAERRGCVALRQPADPLHAAGARGGIRAGADLDRPGRRHPGVEPDRRRAALRQIPPRRSRPRRARGISPNWGEPPIRDEEQLYDIVEVLVEIGEARGVSAAQVALAWLLGRPGRHLARHRRAHRGAVRRQPRRRRPDA